MEEALETAGLRADRRAPEAISFSTPGVVVRAMNRVMGACARMGFVARRILPAEASVAMPVKCVRFKSVLPRVRHAPIRMNAGLRNIVNTRWGTRVWEVWPMRGAWAARKRLRANVYPSRRRALLECLRRSPMNRSRASKLVNTNLRRRHFRRN